MFYAYFRVSTQTQADHNGIQMQKDVVYKYIAEKNIVLDGEFCDLGISGTAPDRESAEELGLTMTIREGVTDLLAVLQKGDKVIVQNTSRLWRSDVTKVMIRHEIEKVGADIISVEQPNYSVYTKDPNDFLFNGMLELLDQYERMIINIKLSKGRRAKARKGSKSCGTAPIGYRWENNDIVVDWNNNLIVQDIFRAYIELKSLAKLQTYCEEKGYRTNQGNAFSKQALKNILNNDFYVGVVTHADRKVTGSHTPIVDREIFQQANAILSR